MAERVKARSLRKNTVPFSGEKKKQNKWRVNRPCRLERRLAKIRAMGPAEAGREETAEEFFPLRQQVLRRIFTAHRRIASKPSKACLAQCSSRHETRVRKSLRKLTRNTSTFQPT